MYYYLQTETCLKAECKSKFYMGWLKE